MTNSYDHILAKGDGTPLSKHLLDVANVASRIASYVHMDETTARLGALLHDIGKASPLFQKSLKAGQRRPGEVFRHEIASLFFISLVEESRRAAIVEMIAAHHKSVVNDARQLGLLDLDDADDSFVIHSKRFDEWSDTATGILSELGVNVHHITIEEAEDNYDYAVNHCAEVVASQLGYSPWRGLLMAADHYASALNDYTEANIDKMFIKPKLDYYERRSALYPLSLVSVSDSRQHTIVTAPTGAGKTDFLLRRCQGRVFYTLPFQASINAMYDRLKSDLSDTDAQIYLLHAASELKVVGGTLEERILQHHIGASVKVLTPHQLAAIAFGVKGYETMIMDLRGEDVILDEVHTYSGHTQAMVLKIIEVLVSLGCRVHVGTATMPTVLYEKIKLLLGGDDTVYEVALPDDVLTTFNRHIIHKVEDIECCYPVVDEAVSDGKKVLIVCNQVRRAQSLYEELRSLYPDVGMMLIHSRYKRGDRNRLEGELKDRYDKGSGPCIVVSTQVVEVSLDISFDVMVTECAPIDAMIQRFGRINRRRTAETIGHYKPIYVVAPQVDKDARPYDEAVLTRSYDALPDGDVLDETKVQSMLDYVYPVIDFKSIDFSGAIYKEGKWMLSELCHNSKAALLETLDINTAVCVTESDVESYENATATEASQYEIPCSYHSIAHLRLEQRRSHLRPFVIPDRAYSQETGLLMDELSPANYKSFEMI